MDTEKIKEIVKEAVAESLSSKERAALLAQVEVSLTEASAKIEELVTNLAEKGSVLAEAQASLEERTAAVEVLTTELESEKKSREELAAQVENLEAALSEKSEETSTVSLRAEEMAGRISELEKTLSDINLEKTLMVRLADLEAAGVRRPGEAGEAQKEKVKLMADEDFSTYKTEMVALKEEILAAAQKDSREVVTETAGLVLNIETKNSNLSDKYKDFGTALAEKVKGRRNSRK